MKKKILILLMILQTYTNILQAQYFGGNGRGDASINLNNVNINISMNLNLKIIIEAMYYESFNQMARRDTVTVYLRETSPPYTIRDSSKGVINNITLSGLFNFENASSGTYYLVVKHHNCIETWSKAGGEFLVRDGSTYSFDFTNSNTKAYGNNLKRVDNFPVRYGIYSGDVNQNGTIDLADVIQIYNDASFFMYGFNVTDLNGDNQTDLSDVLLGYNNSNEFVSLLRP